ncbi:MULTISPECIES: hypothetical protein [Acetobacter]|uniref:hypothetical protein n=1 Tax=Acetobacter TaxID=434 RepID=UPI000676E891|nr:hypothetical protein [Acetobacter pasteurianus]AKR48454.1 hypothetical protein DB34_05560 [Acetobacter pasteurianus]
MTTQNWPDPKRPGVPMFPERDGWHWIHIGNGSGPRPFYWCSKAQGYFTSTEVWAHRWKYTKAWEYHGPVLTPTQINEMLAAERERAAKKAQEISDEYYDERELADNDDDRVYYDERMCAASECAKAIRNLGAAA